MLEGWFAENPNQAESALELALMVAIASEVHHNTTLDRASRAIQVYPQLASVSWDWVLEHITALEQDAPLFSESRPKIAANLDRSPALRLAITLAAQFCFPLADEAKAILLDVTLQCGIPTEEFEYYLDKSNIETLKTPRRAHFNAAEKIKPITVGKALEKADTTEQALLLFKLQAIRTYISLQETPVQLLVIGQCYPVASQRLWIDAVIQGAAKIALCRFLAKDESLHPTEHKLFRILSEQTPSPGQIVLGYETSLSPPDEAFAQLFTPDVLTTIHLETEISPSKI